MNRVTVRKLRAPKNSMMLSPELARFAGSSDYLFFPGKRYYLKTKRG